MYIVEPDTLYVSQSQVITSHPLCTLCPTSRLKHELKLPVGNQAGK